MRVYYFDNFIVMARTQEWMPHYKPHPEFALVRHCNQLGEE